MRRIMHNGEKQTSLATSCETDSQEGNVPESSDYKNYPLYIGHTPLR